MVNRDFTSIAESYDSSRNIPDHVLSTAFDRLVANDLLPDRGRVLDIGCGTGQLALPLARRGYDVVGVDISEAMLRIATEKADPSWSLDLQVGKAESLEFPDASFDAIVISKLLQHVGEWKAAVTEMVRVARPGSHIIHVNETGAFRHSVRRRMEHLADEASYTHRYAGTIDHNEIAAAFEELGCIRQEINWPDLTWKFQISFGAAIEAFGYRQFAEFWCIPNDLYDAMMEKLRAWAESLEGGFETTETMAPCLKIIVFTVASER